jgi:putative membrane protein
MLLETLLCIFIGIFAGIITGLTPGVHINLISLIVVNFSPTLLRLISGTSLGVFIICMAITHTFLDSLPGIYLGAPDESQVLNVLPGHRMLLKGEAHNAVKLTIIGSLFCLLIALISIPFTIKAMDVIYPIVKNYIGYALIVIMIFMFLREKKLKKIINAMFMFLTAGVFGLVVFKIHTLNQPLFPLLSGLFGLSMLIISLMDKTIIPEQDLNKKLNIEKSVIIKSTISGTFVATIAGFLPGFGSSQAAILGQQLVSVGKDIGDKGFMIMVGGINTANMLTSIATAYILGKARNGAILAVNNIMGSIDFRALIIFLISLLIAAGVATVLALKISKLFSKVVAKVNYTILVSIIIIFIMILTIYFDGFLGLGILITSTAIGILATKLNVGKNHLMGCLILPVILYFVV